jgi:phage gp36-like protein
LAYCTQTDIAPKNLTETQLIQLTDDDNTGSVDSTKVTEAIEKADAVIDGYCAQRYTVPFTDVPPIIEAISVDIAIYNLYSRRVGTMPDIRKNKYENAIKMLKDIEAGRISLGVPAPSENPSRKGSFQKNDRIFMREDMEGF